MIEKIKVSIVIPVYNVSLYLRQCLDSVCNQTLKEIEIICVDDGSTDDSLAILHEYEKKYNNFKVFENKQEGPGAAHARNMGIDHATGEYLLVLDSDDYFDLELAEKTYNKAIESNAEIVIFPVQCFDNTTGNFIDHNDGIDFKILQEKNSFSLNEYPENFLQLTHGAAWNKLFKLSFINDNNIRFQAVHLDDAFFTFSTISIVEKIYILPIKLLYYRMNNNNSQVSNLDREPLAPIITWLKIKELFIEKNIFHKIKTSYFIRVFDICSIYLKVLKEPKNFQILYDELHNGGLEKLGFFEPDAKNHMTKEMFDWATEIKENNIKEYFYNKQFNKEVWRTGLSRLDFPKYLVDKNDKVILYGAGIIGRGFYAQNLLLEYCNIVAWVDKNYNNLHKPVEGLDVLKNGEYDKIIIAVEDEIVVGKIKEDLVGLGIDNNKIKWK